MTRDLDNMATVTMAAGLAASRSFPAWLMPPIVPKMRVRYHQHSKRSWLCRIEQDGRRTRSGTGTTKKAAYVAAYSAK